METASRDRKRIEEFIIPRGTGKAFHLGAGQILRITAHEGKQVADVKFINAHDYREQFCAWWSSCLNSERPSGLITGGTKRITELFSKPPWERVLLRVIDDKVGDHLFNGACSPKIRELMPEFEYLGAETCVDLFRETLAPYGIGLEDLEASGTFNVFMPVRFKDDEAGTWEFLPPSCEKGDFIEFQAEIDILGPQPPAPRWPSSTTTTRRRCCIRSSSSARSGTRHRFAIIREQGRPDRHSPLVVGSPWRSAGTGALISLDGTVRPSKRARF